VREKILQVAVPCSHEISDLGIASSIGAWLPYVGHTYERVLRRQISVRGWIQSRPLNVRIVVGASGGEIYQPNAKSFEER